MVWCESNGIEPRHIQPGKADQNAYIERFNRTYREEVLNAYIFEDLDQVRRISADSIRDYNKERPHESLGSLPPARFRAVIASTSNSTSELST
jgi:putative transposase